MEELSQLLEKLKAGDQAAWEPLVRGQAPRLLAIAWSITGDQHRAEDVLQEVFLRLARGAVAGIRSGCEEAYLARMTARVAIDVLRQDESRRRRERELAMDPKSREEGPLEQAISSEEVLVLQQTFSALPRMTRAALWLHFAEGLGLREVAASLRIPRSTIHERMQEGLKRLRRALGQRGLAPAVLLPWPDLLPRLAPGGPSPQVLAGILGLARTIVPAAPAVTAMGMGGILVSSKKLVLAAGLTLLFLLGGGILFLRPPGQGHREPAIGSPAQGSSAEVIVMAPRSAGRPGPTGAIPASTAPPPGAGAETSKPSLETGSVFLELRDACSGEVIDPAQARLEVLPEEVTIEPRAGGFLMTPGATAGGMTLNRVAAEGYFEEEPHWPLGADGPNEKVVRLQKVLGVAGVVLDEKTGLPVEGAEVRLLTRTASQSYPQGTLVSEERTDAGGAFSLGDLRIENDRKKLILMVEAEGHALHEEVISFPACEPLSDRRVLLPEGFSLSGSVVSEPAELLLGVDEMEVVCHWDSNRSLGRRRSLDARTLKVRKDPGELRFTFAFSHLPAGPYLVNAQSDDRSLTIDNYTPVIDLGQDETLKEPLVLKAGRTIGGVVLDREGVPSKGLALVELWKQTKEDHRLPSVDVDGRGRFEFHGLRPEVGYRLRVFSSGDMRTFDVATDFDHYRMTPDQRSKTVRLFLKVEGDSPPARMEEQEFKYILFNREGKDVRHFSSCCYEFGQEICFPEFEYVVIDPQEAYAPVILPFSDLSSGDNTIAVERGAALEGQVVDAAGKPLRGVAVEAVLDGIPIWNRRTFSAEGGYFRLERLPRTSADLILRAHLDDRSLKSDPIRSPDYGTRAVLVLR